MAACLWRTLGFTNWVMFSLDSWILHIISESRLLRVTRQNMLHLDKVDFYEPYSLGSCMFVISIEMRLIDWHNYCSFAAKTCRK